MPKQTPKPIITADLDFLVGDTTILTIHNQKFSPLEYQYLLTQADGINVRVTRQTNGHAILEDPAAYAQ